MMNNTITASAMNSLLHCPRSFFWSHEVGLQKEGAGLALRFGSAWHRAMEARWRGAEYGDALALAIPEGIDLDVYMCATLAGLLAGYYDHYGPIEKIGRSEPEQQFDEAIEGTHFRMQGKIDNIGLIENMTHALVESKTTGDDISPDSEYWLRLRFNVQVLQYVDASRKMGYDVTEVYYDVTRKPSIRPLKSVPELDERGRKIIVDKNGKRAYATKKIKTIVGKGKKAKTEIREVPDLDKPRQSEDHVKGYTLKYHPESPDEFCNRLWRDTLARPDFYFSRREVAILEDALRQFENQRLALVKMVEHFREQEDVGLISEKKLPEGDVVYFVNGDWSYDKPRDPEAWPRNVSTNTCNFCQYKSFCLNNVTPDLNNLPREFSIKPFNPELDYAATPEDSIATA